MVLRLTTTTDPAEKEATRKAVRAMMRAHMETMAAHGEATEYLVERGLLPDLERDDAPAWDYPAMDFRRVADKHGRLFRVPPIERLKEAEPRQGFLERHQYQSIRRHLPVDLRVAVSIGYHLGWRVRSEVMTLRRHDFDPERGTLALDATVTKTKKPRLVYVPDGLKAEIMDQLARVETLQRETGRVIPWLFPHLEDGLVSRKTGKPCYQRGDRIRDFRRAWASACKRAGCPGMLKHDLRRTAVRNMVNDGTPELTSMQITGHATRSVFSRYFITAPGDLKAAAARMAARDGALGPTSGPTRGVAVARRRVSSDNARTRL